MAMGKGQYWITITTIIPNDHDSTKTCFWREQLDWSSAFGSFVLISFVWCSLCLLFLIFSRPPFWRFSPPRRSFFPNPPFQVFNLANYHFFLSLTFSWTTLLDFRSTGMPILSYIAFSGFRLSGFFIRHCIFWLHQSSQGVTALHHP